MSTIQFGTIYYDPSGADVNTNAQRNREQIVVKNLGSTARSLNGWTIRDAAGHVFRFGAFTLGARKSVYVHTGSGIGNAVHVYWGSRTYIWNNNGDSASLRNQHGTLADFCSYPGGGIGIKAC